jgi:hypothetical protein
MGASHWVWSVGALVLCACGGGDDGGGGDDETEPGTVTAEWSSYCVATFTKDYAVMDAFDEALFTARAGEQYLMTAYGDGFSTDTASLAYLTDSGPYEFEVTAPAGTQNFPFTTSCTFGSTVPYYAAFTDVTLYVEEALTTKLCDVPSGTVLPRDTSTGAGYGTTSLNFSGPTTYEIFLNAFSAQCGNAGSGFASVPSTDLFGFTTWLVPIIQIVGPN